MNLTEEELVKDLIEEFKIKRDYWQQISLDRAWGIQECLNHLYSYQSILKARTS
jgi:hypothetical protein